MRLLRATSEIPNITPRDDAFHIYHAYGGNGIVSGVGEDLKIDLLSYSFGSGTSYRVHSGLVCILGYEIEVEEQEVSTASSGLYLKVDLLRESVSLVDFREVPAERLTKYSDIEIYGQDPMMYPSAVFCVLIAAVRSTGGGTHRLDETLPILIPFEDRIKNLRLDTSEQIDLVRNYTGGSVYYAYVRKSGNYVFGRIDLNGTSVYQLPNVLSFSFPEGSDELIPVTNRTFPVFILPTRGANTTYEKVVFTVNKSEKTITSEYIQPSWISNGCSIDTYFWYQIWDE